MVTFQVEDGVGTNWRREHRIEPGAGPLTAQESNGRKSPISTLLSGYNLQEI